MIFLIDAQLPRRLAHVLQQYGHQAYHTLDLPQQNRTDDDEIMQFADTRDCIVTTKDSGFVDAFYLQNRPQKLWLLSTGNISNRYLLNISGWGVVWRGVAPLQLPLFPAFLRRYSNRDLDALIRANIDQIVVLFHQYRFVELSRTDLIAHV